MATKKVRSIIAIIVVCFFLLITGVLALLPLLNSETNFTLESYMAYFSKIANIYTGFIGVIIGYYFGKSIENEGNDTISGREVDTISRR